MKISSAPRDQLQIVKSNLTSSLDGLASKIDQINGELRDTDVFIDRYLPCRILNDLKFIFEEAFGDYADKKSFLDKLDEKFKLTKEKIEQEEQQE